MRGRLVRCGVAAMVAALVAGSVGAGGVGPAGAEVAAEAEEAALLSVPGMAVSLAQAGELALWGDSHFGQATVPASLAGVAVSQVVFPLQATLALTADGRVVGWGGNPFRLEQVPAQVAAAKVAQISTMPGGKYAGAVTRDGRVMTWGPKASTANPLAVPAGLSGVKQVAMAANSAAALRTDGSVVAWGWPGSGQTTVPEGLKATAIAALANGYLALTEQGTVVAWGAEVYSVTYAPLQQPGNVKAIAAGRTAGALALLADNTLVQFGLGPTGPPELPPEVAAADPVLLANGGPGHEFAIVDSERTIHTWKTPVEGYPDSKIPAELNGRALAQIELANGTVEVGVDGKAGGVVITKLLRAELPRLGGTVRVGSVVTGVPGTFSAQPDSVTSQWLVGGVAVPGSGAQLTVTPAMVGKSIVYRSSASKVGEASVSASSAPVVVPPVVVPPVSSSTKVVKVTVAKKAAKVAVTGKVTASKSPAGRATVTIKKGSKTIVTKTVGVSASGAVTLSVKKFGKLAIKKTRSKSKTGYKGKYAVTIRYLGNKQVKAGSGSRKFTVRK